MDYTGTGNTLNVRHPHTLQLIMDSLRYWVLEMHVDGFRFDLAATLAREFYDVDRLSAFFDLVQQDPTVSQVKLIAEPWDVGPGGYQVGNFPPQWTEWNGKYRDTVRDFWRGEPATLGEFAARITGSPDLYEHSGRRPFASINFVTAHDGFTLRDLVSYNEKHNEANGEGNRDGESHNRSWNCGVEGDTDDLEVLELRAQQQRNFIATLFLSQGVPMLLHGDEMGRTQRGNNNAYCQDNDITWVDWAAVDERPAPVHRAGLPAAPGAPGLPAAPVLRRPAGAARGRRAAAGHRLVHPGRQEMAEEDWEAGFGKSVAVFLNGDGIPDRNSRGERVTDDSFIMIFNAHDGSIDFTLPAPEYGAKWEVVLDTATPQQAEPAPAEAAETLTVEARSLAVLRKVDLSGRPRLDLPGAGGPGLRPARGRRAGRLPGRARASATSTRRRCSPRRRLHARLRRGRPPARPTRRRGGEAGRLQLAAALRAHGLGLVLDLVPNHAGVAAAAENPAWWDVLRLGAQSAYARWFDIDWSARPAAAAGAGRLPRGAGRPAAGRRRAALLRAALPAGARHRGRSTTRARRTTTSTTSWCPGGAARPSTTTGGSSRSATWPRCGSRTRPSSPPPTPRCCAGSPPATWTGCGSTTRTGWPTRPATWRGCADRAPGAWVVVEKILEPGEDLPDWPVAGTTGYDALAEVDGVLVDPAGEAPFTALDEPAHRRADVLAGPGARRQAGGRDRHAARRGAPARRARAGRAGTPRRRWPSCWPAFPVYRSYLPGRCRAPGRGGGRGGALAAGPRRRRGPVGSSAGRPGRPAGRALPADLGRGDGEGRRGHRVLPVDPVRRAQRGRRRPGPVRPAAGGVPRCAGAAAAAAPGRDDHAVHPRHQAVGGRPRPARRAGGAAGGVGHRGRPVVGGGAAAGRGARAPALADAWSGAWPLPAERLHAYLEKATREARTRTSWNDPDHGLRGGDARRRGRGARLAVAAFRRLRLRRADHPLRLVQRADRDCWCS